MFPSRYFNLRYWASRYWPKVGEDPPVSGADCYTVFSGIITDEVTAGQGLIADDFAENGIITEYSATNGLITEVIQWTSQVNVTQATLVGGIITLSQSGEPVGDSMNGLIGTTTTAVNGLIDDSGIAVNSKLCCC